MTDGRLNQEVLSSLPDDELMTELTAISGIGVSVVDRFCGAPVARNHRDPVTPPHLPAGQPGS